MADIPAWMTRDLPLAGTAAGLNRLADTLGQGLSSVSAQLLDAAASMGWQGQAVARAQSLGGDTSSAAAALVGAVRVAGRAVADLAAALDEHGPPLRDLPGQLDSAHRAWQDAVSEDAARIDSYVGAPDASRSMRAREQVDALERAVQEHVEALASADRACRTALQLVAEQLSGLTGPASDANWTGSMVPAAAGAVLAGAGVVDTDEQAALWVTIRSTNPDAAGLVHLLQQVPTSQLEAFLGRHPAVAYRLAAARDWPPGAAPGSPEALLAGAMASRPVSAIDTGSSFLRVDRVREVFARLDASARLRLSLLYPAIIGSLDGAPIPERIRANRALVAKALIDERQTEWRLEQQPSTSESVREAQDALGLGPVPLGWAVDVSHNDNVNGLVVHLEDRDDRLARSRMRIGLYQRLLSESVPDPSWRDPANEAPQVHRQVLLFDPSGDGRIAELWGHLDPGTDNVAVYAPGTTNELSNFGAASDTALNIVTGDPARRTAAVAWLGCDLPDAVAANAPQAHYAETGGPMLRDFVHAVDTVPGAAITVVGHSYGGAVVGVADREGLTADRVVHVESAGLGQNVRSTADLPSRDPSGAARRVARFSMTAPGDLIGEVQGAQVGGLGLGGDPDLLDGVHQLETGRHTTGSRAFIHGPNSHSEVLSPDTTAWANVLAVVQGAPFVPTADQQWVSTSAQGVPVVQRFDPYQDPDFSGTAKEDFPR